MKMKTCALLLAAICAFAPGAHAISYLFQVDLKGSNEVGGGDPDGEGSGWILINSITNKVTWEFVIQNIDTITAAHIHDGDVGLNGPPVVNFSGLLSGSVDSTGPVVQAIIAAPDGYYVNYHTTAHAPGAVRGQLSTPRVVPDSLGFGWAALAVGLTLVAGRRMKRPATAE